MFAGHTIDAITNGVHAATGISHPFQELYDRYIPGWREDNSSLRYAFSIPKEEIWEAHQRVKGELIQYMNRTTHAGMEGDILTIGFARRATPYKRGDLFFQDIERLRTISSKTGPFQIIYGGKAHPQDQGGKELIKRIFQAKERLKDNIRIAYIENYYMELGKMITSGVDLWLNTHDVVMIRQDLPGADKKPRTVCILASKPERQPRHAPRGSRHLLRQPDRH